MGADGLEFFEPVEHRAGLNLEEVGDGRGDARRHHGDPGPGQLGHGGQAVGGEAGVDHDGDGADLENAEEGAGVLGRVGEGEKDPFLLADPEAEEGVPEAVGQPVDVGVGQLPVGQAQGDPLASPLPYPLGQEQVGDVQPLRGVHGGKG